MAKMQGRRLQPPMAQKSIPSVARSDTCKGSGFKVQGLGFRVKALNKGFSLTGCVNGGPVCMS